MAADCNSLAQARATGTVPVSTRFEGAAPNSVKFGDKTPAQAADKPLETGW